MVGSSRGSSIRVLARACSAAVVKSAKRGLVTFRTPLVWALGAWCAIGGLGLLQAAWTPIDYFENSGGYRAVWDNNGVVEACFDDGLGGGLQCCSPWNNTTFSCDSSAGPYSDAFGAHIHRAFGLYHDATQYLVNTLFAGSEEDFTTAAGTTFCPNCTYTATVCGGLGDAIIEDCDGTCRTYFHQAGFFYYKPSSCTVPSCNGNTGTGSPERCCTGDMPYWCTWFDLCGTPSGCDPDPPPPPPPSCTGSCTWWGDGLGGWDKVLDCAAGCGCPCPESGSGGAGSAFSTNTACTSGSGGGSSCSYPPPDDPCEDNGGDTDGDGCCDDVDCYTSDPDFCTCTPGPCEDNGGDGDYDGCCADVDVNDSDPDICGDDPVPCTGTCSWTVSSTRDSKGRLIWSNGTSTCAGTECHCCPPVDRPTDEDDTATNACTTADPCPLKCDARGGDHDDDDCCRDEDHDDDNDQVCNGVCDGWKELCKRRLPGPDMELDTDDDVFIECDPDVPPESGDEPCECERLENGDQDEDECCDFDERNEAEADDPEKGCECCLIEEQWKKAKGCLVEWEWNRIWGRGPRILSTAPTTNPDDAIRPDDCEDANVCTGTCSYTASRTTQGDLIWDLGSGSAPCGGSGCHCCPPAATPIREGQVIENKCTLQSCDSPYDVPEGDPDNTYSMTFPMNQLTNGTLSNFTLTIPLTIEGWKSWMQDVSGSGQHDALFDQVDSYRQWFRSACLFFVGIMLAGVVFKELKV